MPFDNYPPLLQHILSGAHYGPLLRSAEVEAHRRDWRELMRALTADPPRDLQVSDKFHVQWHVAGHYIRELVGDDELLTDMLWVWLPRYRGSTLTLYRGENIDRYEGGSIGTAWSDQNGTARMFASGLNAVGQGGTILQITAGEDAIIAGPSAHSRYLQEFEYTVDWRKAGTIDRIGDFPPAFAA